MIPDEDFITDENIPGPTKEEIRCMVICKSEVSPDDIVVDVGCGTGGLTVEFAKIAKKVYAIDRNPEALKLTEKNLKKHGVYEKVNLIEGDALQILDSELDKVSDTIPDFDILMIGGSSGDLTSIIKKGYKKLKNKGKVIVTSIMLETRVEAVKTLQTLDMIPEVVEISISKGRIVEKGTMMLARNPVTIVSAKKTLIY
ncbi:MAG: precorrin-6Y C5,15-methyltransferase (decarboxylating) subunit CbiT [Euryarchaeota archaeon]|nr:precorrin-6Y C5,15-methyltransferase (decarboxylating) subunit CbiT [Euryarchaeota archaeon]